MTSENQDALTTDEQSCLALLQKMVPSTAWAEAIKSVESIDDPARFRKLVCEIKEMIDHNTGVMRLMLGDDLLDAINKLFKK